MDKNNKEYNSNFEDEDFFKFDYLINLYLRKKFLILTLSSLSILSSLVYASLQKHVWEGSFQIVVNKPSSNGVNLNLMDRLRPDNLGIPTSDSININSEIAIIESPSVLMPVFALSKEVNKNPENESFYKWRNNNFEIKKTRGTKVLNIFYRDTNKSSIIPILNKISDVYKKYSKKDQDRKIKQRLSYLEEQVKIMSKKSKDSINEMQTFALKYGLSNIDGIPKENDLKNDSEFTKRYKNHNLKLSLLEAELIEKSSILKPESKIIIILEQKIKSLKESITRPREIILKYRELKLNASRNEQTYSLLKTELLAINLKKAEANNPWQLISDPTLLNTPVAPSKKFIVLNYSFLGILISFFIAYVKDYLSGKVYDIETFKKSVSYPFLFILETKIKEESEPSFYKLSEILLNSKTKSLKIVAQFKIEEGLKEYIIGTFKKFTPSFEIIEADNLMPLNKGEKQILLFKEGIKKDSLKQYNDKLTMHIDSLIGWIYIKK